MNGLSLVTKGMVSGRGVTIVTKGYITRVVSIVDIVFTNTKNFILYIMRTKGFTLER